jgi:hypothetical protein
MKSPPEQHPDPVARQMVADFIEEYGGAPKLPGQKPAPAETQPAEAETETTIDTA